MKAFLIFYNKYINYLIATALILVFFIPSKFVVTEHTFNNWDIPNLESYLKNEKLEGKIYVDGARPYYIHRQLKNVRGFFYDLNPRAKSINDIQNYLGIEKCFSPDYWIISKLTRTQEEFDSLRQSFSNPVFSDKDIFISKKILINTENSSINCSDLKMKG